MTAACTLLSSSLFAQNEHYPSWIVRTPAGHGAYCINIKNSVEDAKMVAIQFAKEEIGLGIQKAKISGREVLKTVCNKGSFSTDYQSEIEAISRGEDFNVVLVSDEIVKNELCVLVKTQNINDI